MALIHSYRDRTNEFQNLVAVYQSKPAPADQAPSIAEPKNVFKANLQQRQAFIQAAKKIGQRLTDTCIRLEKLAQLAKKQSLFNDNSKEIQVLTFDIKREINDTNAHITQLQDFVKRNKSNDSKSIQKHSSNVVYTLQSKLANVSKDFKDVLEVRNENLKHQNERGQQFFSKNIAASMLAPPKMPGSSMGKSVLLYDDPAQGASASSSLNSDSVLNMDLMQKQQLQKRLIVNEEELFLQDRANAMETVEKTIIEIGSMMSSMAQMVREQDEQVGRIGVVAEEIETNVFAANDELAKHLKSISSNKWLLFKVFCVIIVFMIFFILVLA